MYVLVIFACAASVTFANPSYSNYYNYEIDINSIINNPSKAAFYYNCIMETGQCDRESALMRFFISEALKGCYECPERMKPALQGFLRFLVTVDEDRFLVMAAKYDETDGIFRRLYQKRLERITQNSNMM